MFKVTFRGKSNAEIDLEGPANLLTAAAQGKASLTHRCGGHARCGTCLVTIEQGQEALAPVGPAESRVLNILKAAPEQRLACQAQAQGDVCCRIE